LISINPITSDVYNGKQSGSVSIDTRPALTVYTVNLKTDKVDANKLLSSVSSIKKMLYGLLTSNVNASFTADSADAIARSLNGKVNLNLNDGKLTGLDVMHELAMVGKFLGKTAKTPAQGYTSITSLTGNFDVKNGVAVTNDLKAVLNGSSLAGAGSINLASESLAMHVTAVLTKTLSQQVGGTQVGGLMSTALTNSQGELVIPILVTGSFQHPLVAPDVEQFARMKLQNLIPNSKNPASVIENILGAAGGKQQQDQQPNAQPNSAAQPQQPASKDPFGDLLKGVMKKKDAKKQ
jgi:AsmA protein